MRIERPDKDGNGCSLDCGVAFVHTHPDGKRNHPAIYEPEMKKSLEEQLLILRSLALKCQETANEIESRVDELYYQLKHKIK